jgi:hypothetical protein
LARAPRPLAWLIESVRQVNDGVTTMARKPGSKSEYVFFDVIYDDGSQRSNRRVPKDILGGIDGDEPARAVIEEQDREIAERSGRPMAAIKELRRSS